MTPDLSTCRKVAGIKQTMRALREHRAEKLYIACDADPAVLAPIEALAREENIAIAPRWRSLATARASPLVRR